MKVQKIEISFLPKKRLRNKKIKYVLKRISDKVAQKFNIIIGGTVQDCNSFTSGEDGCCIDIKKCELIYIGNVIIDLFLKEFVNEIKQISVKETPINTGVSDLIFNSITNKIDI